MPEIVGRARMPRLPSAPTSPAPGELYFDTTTNILYFWDGTAWVSTKSSAGTVYDTDQIGTVKSFTGTVIPTNWMLADGRTLVRNDYPQLADAMGVPAQNTSFTLPDLRKKFIYGKNAPTDAIVSGGAATHQLTLAEMASHDHGGGVHAHSVYDPSHNHNIGLRGSWDYGGYDSALGSVGAMADSGVPVKHAGTGIGIYNSAAIIGAQGGNGVHNNMPPYVELAWIIKVTGVQVDSGGALVGATGPAGSNAMLPGGVAGDVMHKLSSVDSDVVWRKSPGYVAKTMAGNSAGLALGAVIPGLNITIPAQPVPVHARVMCKFRVNHVGGSGWYYSGCYIRCTPAAVAGGSANLWDTLLYTYGSGGPQWISHTPHNYFDLAANQAYTIDVMFQAAAAVFNWDGEASWLEASWFPR